jgi:hypothetical protein
MSISDDKQLIRNNINRTTNLTYGQYANTATISTIYGDASISLSKYHPNSHSINYNVQLNVGIETMDTYS